MGDSEHPCFTLIVLATASLGLGAAWGYHIVPFHIHATPEVRSFVW